MKNKIDDLFIKTIASLVSVKIISHNEEIKKVKDEYKKYQVKPSSPVEKNI